MPSNTRSRVDVKKIVIIEGTEKVIASDTKEPESEVAFAFIVIRFGSKHLRSQ
jgi:hypothetical protein